MDPLPYVPYGTPPELAIHIDAAYDAGILTGVRRNTSYGIVTLPNTSADMECQRKYFQHGLRYSISLAQTIAVPAPAPVPAPIPQVIPEARDRSLAPKLNPPKTFTGIRTDYQAFILQLNLIFNSDPYRYQGDATKISYAASFLSGSALEWFKPHVSDEGIIDFDTWGAFVNSLKAAFDDPDARATAEQKLRTLKQGTKDCAAYHAEFAPVATQLRLDHVTRISWFKHGLSYEVGKMMITQPHTENFNEYVKQAIQVDNALRALNNRNPRNSGGQFTAKPAGTTNNTAPSTPSTSTGVQPGPMDLSAARKRGPLTAAEKKRCRDNSLCLYCGSPGHWATTCPQKKRRTAASATVESEGGVPLPPTIIAAPAPVPTINSAICASPAQILYEPKNY